MQTLLVTDPLGYENIIFYMWSDDNKKCSITNVADNCIFKTFLSRMFNKKKNSFI